MRVIGLDYGKRKVGVAMADGPLAEPMRVVRGKNFQEVLEKTVSVVQALEAEKLVVGLSEGRMAFEQNNFASHLAKLTGLSVELQDETLSTRDAQKLSIEGAVPRLKRRRLEDAYAAAVILQSYLDK